MEIRPSSTSGSQYFTLWLPSSFYLLHSTVKTILENKKVVLFIILGLSVVNTILMEIISGIALFIVLFVVSLNYMQEHHSKILPRVLRDWTFLPKPLRTLETIDYVVQTYMEVGVL